MLRHAAALLLLTAVAFADTSADTSAGNTTGSKAGQHGYPCLPDGKCAAPDLYCAKNKSNKRNCELPCTPKKKECPKPFTCVIEDGISVCRKLPPPDYQL